MGKFKRLVRTLAICLGLFIATISLQFFDEIVVMIVGVTVGSVSLLALVNPIKSIGLGHRAMSIYVLILATYALSPVFASWQADMLSLQAEQQAAKDAALAELRRIDPPAYLTKVRKLHGEDAWLEALKEMDPEWYEIERDRRARARAREASKTQEKTALEIRQEYDERCQSASARGYAYHAAQRFVAQQLKSPATAKFPSERDVAFRPTGTCSFEISGHVDAQNSFGATLRMQYTATVTRPDTSGDSWRLDALRVQ